MTNPAATREAIPRLIHALQEARRERDEWCLKWMGHDEALVTEHSAPKPLNLACAKNAMHTLSLRRNMIA